ncbi:peptidase C39 [Trinickia acidisoli]|uniref:peptidase C39 n=1 Tax=Trinickia acidisoli TaxID=2767482 RepID=UPI001A8CF069|nr:peptidase C39 [Trinickia acidisoli]
MKHFIAAPLKIALALAACGIAGGTHATERLAAAPEFLSLQAGGATGGAQWQAVDDDVLSHQTGKAPGATIVSGLVLELMSQWQMPNGGSAAARGTLTVTTNANDSLSAQVSTSAQASDGTVHGKHSDNGANPQASATGGQNISINGVSQVTQVAGDGNASTNSAVIDFNGSGSTTLAALGAANTNSTNSASASATSASGNVKAAVTFGNGGVALTLQTPAGVATQTISPTLAQGSGSIAQLVQVAGNAQAVVNQLQLSIQTQAMSSTLLRQLGVLQAMQNSALLRH